MSHVLSHRLSLLIHEMKMRDFVRATHVCGLRGVEVPVNRASNYILTIVSLGVALLLLETGFRVMAYYTDVETLESLQFRPPAILQGTPVSFGQIIRLSKNPRIIYELIPQLSVYFTNRPLKVNAFGFRGEHVQIEKPPRTVRIVGLGDSLMFGWGIRDNEAYMALLGKKLNENYPSISWEIVNTAVPGYNTVMEVETLKQKGLAYRPDIVIIDYVINDTDLPNFIVERENYFSLRQSFIMKFINSRKLRSVRVVVAPLHAQETRFENDPRRVPAPYREMVGTSAVRNALHELSSLSKQHNFEVIVLSHSLLPQWIGDICRTLQFHRVETGPEWEKFVRTNNISEPERIWQLSKDDLHPSVIAHQVICHTLFQYLEESGLARKITENMSEK